MSKLHKCKHKGCKNKTQYMFCFVHKDDIYTDVCKIHGKTKFKNYHCLKCEEMKKPKYSKDKKVLEYLDEIFGKRLKHKNRRYQAQYIQRISPSAGIYGIFVKTSRGLGKCLYVGQSVNVSTRVKQHKENFKKAQRHLIGLKTWHRKLKVYKVEYKYYEMARKYKLSDLQFVRLCTIPKKYLHLSQFNDIITYMEQFMMDSYKPSLNTFAARPNFK